MSVQLGAWHVAGSQHVMHRAVGFFFFLLVVHLPGLPRWLSGKESICRRPGFDPWVEETPLEEEMATHSSVPVWEIIARTEEPGESSHSATTSTTTAHLPFKLKLILNSPNA